MKSNPTTKILGLTIGSTRPALVFLRTWEIHAENGIHACTIIKKAFTKIGEAICIRRGGRIELRYHLSCFSGMADPRTQANSSAHSGKWAKTVAKTRAPNGKYRKMRTSSHW
eukprot:1343963-Amorphochlora_amoeboformis.AAC.2